MAADSEQPAVDIALSDEAIDWLVKLNSGRASPEERLAFVAWRQESADHELAARSAEALWYGVGIAGKEVRREQRKAKLARRTVVGGAIVLAGSLTLERSGVIGPHLLADHTTTVGEQRTITLADGSSVVLNADTALSENFTAIERRLHLFKGEAVFNVAHDSARPFLVNAGDGHTRAIGTVFNIDVRLKEVVVTVLEGVVEVATGERPPDAVTVTADHRVRYAAAGRPSEPEAVQSEIETAWRRGKMIFNRRPLGEVVSELERYRRGRIVITSDRLRLLEVTGVFDLAEPEAVLTTIENTLPVRVTRLPLVTVIR